MEGLNVIWDVGALEANREEGQKSSVVSGVVGVE